MKINKNAIVYIAVMVLAASLYRVIPGRPYGFAPQIAIALFGGMIFKNRVMSFMLPLASMLVSDALYQILFLNGYTDIQGFYSGMWVNYLCLASVVLIGWAFKQVTVKNVLLGSLLGPTWFFLISNFFVWLGSVSIPQTGAGLLQTYTLGLPFYQFSVTGTLFFSAVLFSVWYVVVRKKSIVKAS